MNKKIILYVSIAIVIVIVLVIGMFLSKRNNTKTGEITIIEYFPQSGPVGSYVALKLDSVPEGLRALYDGEEIIVDGMYENIVKVIIPVNAQSGEIQLKTENAISDSVPFTIKEMELIELTSEIINPSSEKQIINYEDKIKVTLPPGLLEEDKKLTISEIKNAPAHFMSDQVESHSFDVSLEGMDQLDDYVEIGVKYDPSLLDPDEELENQFIAMRWDEDGGYWINLPIRVDSQSQTLYMLTDHLTGFEWAIIGAAVLVTKPITLAGEKLLNNSYVTPQGNFKILYSKSAIEEDVSLSDDWWVKKTYSDAGQINYDSNHPKSIQDVGNLFEIALDNYLDLGFENPIEIKEEWFGDGRYKNPIIVKIDSWWLAISGEPNYEKIWQRIHIPSIRLKEKDFMKMTIGHELFHRLQAEYYGRVGFLAPSNGWWLEATAEYAGHNVAWPDDIPGMNDQIGSDYLSHSISTKGIIKGYGWSEKRYEYASAVFIKYLVENKGFDFNQLFEYVEKGSPLERLNSFARSKGGDFLSYYKDFASWAAFSSNSFLTKYPLTSSGPEGIAEEENSISLAEGQSSLDIEINAADGQDMLVSIFKISNRSESTPVSLANLSGLSGFDKYSIQAEPGDTIYLLAVNGSDKDKSINTVVKNNSQKKEGEIKYTFNLEGNYSAKIWAIKIEGALKLTGNFVAGIEGMGYGQEVYRINNSEYRIDIDGEATLYIDSNCELWYYQEINEEGCVYDVSGFSEGQYEIYYRNEYMLSDGSKYWTEWKINPGGGKKDLTGVINSRGNSYYQAKVNSFNFLVRPSKDEMNTINSLGGKYDSNTKRFYAEAFVDSIPGKGVYLRWESQPVDIDFRKDK